MFLLSFIYQTYIEEPPPAAIVCHPHPPSGGATRSPLSLFDCCVMVHGVLIGLPLSSKWCLQRTSANLIVAIPLLIAIRKEEVTTQSDGRDVRQEHHRYIMLMML